MRVGDGQGSLACCSPWGNKAMDTNERLNNNKWAGWTVLLKFPSRMGVEVILSCGFKEEMFICPRI